MLKDGTYWAEQFKTKKVSPEEFLATVNNHINRDNPTLNAMVSWDVARHTDAVIRHNLQESQPFSGLPIPLKMLGQEKAGYLVTNGSRLFQNNIATRTSHFVEKLEKVGFVPAGRTNAPEFGFKNITDSALYGTAKNPWNPEFSPGGSSGGAASVVASGLFPIAAASDGGGSIRIPAAFCGLIGLKPTRGTMPNGPTSWRGWQGAAIDFALTVSMRDTETLFYALRGNSAIAPYQAPQREWEPQKIEEPLNIAYLLDSPVLTPVSLDAKKAVKQVVNVLANAGHFVTEIDNPVDGVALINSYYLMNGAETAAMFASIEKKLNRPVTMNDMELMTWGIYQYGKKIPAKKYIQALDLWDVATAKMEQLFEQYDLVLTPTTAMTAPKLTEDFQSQTIRQHLTKAAMMSEAELAVLTDQFFAKGLRYTPFTQLANLTGQPAISLPTYVASNGLPLGIHFTAAKGHEDLLFEIGKYLEQEQLFKLPKAYQD